MACPHWCPKISNGEQNLVNVTKCYPSYVDGSASQELQAFLLCMIYI